MSSTVAAAGRGKVLLKIAWITVATVYGGHKLVQYVSPTEEELLAVRIVRITISLFKCALNRDFLKIGESITWRESPRETINERKGMT